MQNAALVVTVRTQAWRRSRRLGYTLMEVVVVVALIGVMAAIAVSNISRQRQTRSVETQIAYIHDRIQRAQALASVAGSRLGTVRLVYGPGCTPPGGVANPDGTNPLNQLWIRVAPPNIEVPVALVPVGPNLRVDCQTYAINLDPENGSPINAAFVGASLVNAAQFAFTSSGRLIFPAAPAQPYVYLQAAIPPALTPRFGLKFLASGVACRTSVDNPAAPCTEEI